MLSGLSCFVSLRLRSLFNPGPLELIEPTEAPFGRENFCYENAFTLNEKFGLLMCSGWLCQVLSDQTQIQFTQHWWNYDPAKQVYFDCSPGVGNQQKHILDPNLSAYVLAHMDTLTSHVGSSVLLARDNNFYLIDYGPSGIEIGARTNLSNEDLFSCHSKPHTDL